MPTLIALFAGLFVVPLIVGGGMVFNYMREDRGLAARFIALHQKPGTVALSAAAGNMGSVLLRAVSAIGEWVLHLGLLSGASREALEVTLRGAGQSGTAALRLFVGFKILLLALLPLAAWLLVQEMALGTFTQILVVAGTAVGGMLAPDMAVQKLRGRHVQRIVDELPDALDMMVICAQAGLGLGTTILRVAHELRTTHRAIAVELAQTANEMQMMTDGKQPLINLGTRCGVDSAKRLAATLVQSAQYGTPLTEALRGLAAELRTELITRFEARAARMPVLLTMPMVGFILPSLFLVLAGPAIVQVIHAID
jgi:tight adherence protein C